MIRANNFARCPCCMVLSVIGDDLQPSPDLSCDEAAFNAAMNANPEITEWALRTLETARIRNATGIKAECVAAREWLKALGGPDLVFDLATLDAHTSSFDEKGSYSAIMTGIVPSALGICWTCAVSSARAWCRMGAAAEGER
jgi:hypothetical protein